MSTPNDEEKAWMLPDNDSCNPSTDDNTYETTRRPSKTVRLSSVHGLLVIAQLAFLAFNICLFRTPKERDVNCPMTTNEAESVVAPFSPAAMAVQYDVHVVDTHKSGARFTGEPRPEVDKAWSDLLKATIVRISADEMRQMNRTSATLADGSGYAGYLEAYHMLHCVKRMYQIRHPEYYSAVKEQGFFELDHWDHCVEVLRQGVLCHADLTINTLYQANEDEVHGRTAWPRKCTNWDHIQQWAESRALPLVPGSQSSILVPKGHENEFGPADLL